MQHHETLYLLRTIPVPVVCLFAACENPQGLEDLQAPTDLIESEASASNEQARALIAQIDDQ